VKFWLKTRDIRPRERNRREKTKNFGLLAASHHVTKNKTGNICTNVTLIRICAAIVAVEKQ
jgi:hypothetical protein